MLTTILPSTAGTTLVLVSIVRASWGVAAGSGTISEPAWGTKPTWYLIATDSRMIPPQTQCVMAKRAGATVVEVKASHAVSQPSAVAALIEQAARTAKAATA